MKPRCGPARSSVGQRVPGQRVVGVDPGSAGRRGAATATASAGNMSVSRLTSSSWRVPSGERPPSAVPTTVNATSPALPPTSTATASRTRAHIARPSASASTRRVRSASVSTRSAERRAAGDSAPPAPPTPTPTSASRIAAASFTPSPVIASVAPDLRSAATSATFCSGDSRANTAVSRTMRTRSASDARSELGAR